MRGPVLLGAMFSLISELKRGEKMSPEVLFGIGLTAFIVLAVAILYILKGYPLSKRSEDGPESFLIRDCHDLCASDPTKSPSVSCEMLCLQHGGA